ncbi:MULTISPECIES: hypothetical protein [Alkalibacillus]|uniref:Uncharacterized protein n=2 Tax=Alkalibacillus TaxID=331654 RepID=A0A511W0F5_9BACI|nr:hypothetical protein [Alkalibacillus haloalkaliphilus]GEN44545.1 hypothetical protein AHA02nite_03210 [Alkalibacillus haloalkaliphilus]
MTTTTAMIQIAIIIVSFLLSFIVFMFISPLNKQLKKQYLDETVSFIINIVLLIWLGKVVFNLSLILTDPMAVLAYPSGAREFYFGITVAVIIFIAKHKKKEIRIIPFLHAFLTIFIFASFIYEFMELIVQGHTYSFNYLTLLFIVLITFVMMNSLSFGISSGVTITLWSLGQLALTTVQPFITIFSYMVSPWFIMIVFMGGISILITNIKKVGAT